jgi:ParB/RepB/Spo0J family partition protein
MKVKIADIHLKGTNREDMGDINALRLSIKEHGLLQPIIITKQQDKLVLIAGERRLRACKANGDESIEAKLIAADDMDIYKVRMTENLQRKDLTIWEEANQVEELKDLQPESTVEELATQLSKSNAWVAHRLQFSKLYPPLLKLFKQQDWPLSHVVLLARYAEPTQKHLFTEIQKMQKQNFRGEWQEGEGKKRTGIYPTLRELKHTLENYNRILKTAPWDLKDESIILKAGACSACPKRSSQQAMLFQEPGDDATDKCLDPVCWEDKKITFVKLTVKKLQAEETPVVFIGDTYGDKITGLPEPVSHYGFIEVKKSEPGAKVAIHVNGRHMGKTIYVKDVSSRSSSVATKKRPIDQETGKPVPPSNKERIAKLRQKRQAHAVGLFVEHLGKMPTPGLIVVLRVAGAFGTEHRYNAGDEADWKRYPAKKDDKQAAAFLMEQVMPVMQKRLFYHGTLHEVPRLWEEVQEQAKIFGQEAELKKMYQQAVEAIPLTNTLAKAGVKDPDQK